MAGLSTPEVHRGWIFDLALGSVTAVGLVVVLFFVFLTPEARSRPTLPAIGVLVDHHSEVRRRVAGSLVWDELADQAELYPRDALYVPPGGFARVRLGDGSDLQIDQRSLVILGERPSPRAPVEGVVHLVRGAASGRTGPSPMAMQVGDQAVALAGEASARVKRSASGAGEVEITVSEGHAEVAGAALPAGSRTVLAEGAVRTERMAVTLRAPDSGHRQGADEPVSFAWSGARRGLAKVELRNAAGEWRVIGAGVDELRHTLPVGMYAWRVWQGGKVSEERNLVIDQPPQVEVFQPRSGELVDLFHGVALHVSWSRLARAQGYRVEIARQPRFAQLWHSEDVVEPHVSVPKARFTEEGTYCLRVQGRREGEPLGVWSAPLCMRVVLAPVLRAPELFEPGVDGEQGSWWRGFIGVAHAQTPSPALRALSLRWEAVPGAVGYEIEIAAQATFDTVVVRERVAEPWYRFTPPQQGTFYWRVRGVDAAGRAGALSEARRITVGVAAPSLRDPKDGGYVLYRSAPPRVELRWHAVADAGGYVIEVSTTASFDDPVRLNAREPSVEHRPTKLGSLFWRVAAVAPDGLQSAFSPARELKVVAAAPQLTQPPSGGAVPSGEVELAWSARPVSRYVVEIGRDPELAQPLHTARISEATLRHTVSEPGTYHWRVRGDAPATAWSEVSTFTVEGAPSGSQPSTASSEPPPPPTPGAVHQREEPQQTATEPTLHLAPRVGYVTNFTRVHAPRFELELGTRLPTRDLDLKVLVLVGYQTMAEHLQSGPVVADARLHVLPLTVAVWWTVPTAWLGGFDFVRFALGAAVTTWLAVASLEGQGIAGGTVTHGGVGAMVGMALLKELGIGSAFLSVEGMVGTPSYGVIAYDPMAMAFSLGYRFYLW